MHLCLFFVCNKHKKKPALAVIGARQFPWRCYFLQNWLKFSYCVRIAHKHHIGMRRKKNRFTCRTYRSFIHRSAFIYVFSLCALRIKHKADLWRNPLSGQRFAGKHFKCRYLHQKQYSRCLTTIVGLDAAGCW